MLRAVQALWKPSLNCAAANLPGLNFRPAFAFVELTVQKACRMAEVVVPLLDPPELGPPEPEMPQSWVTAPSAVPLEVKSGYSHCRKAESVEGTVVPPLPVWMVATVV